MIDELIKTASLLGKHYLKFKIQSGVILRIEFSFENDPTTTVVLLADDEEQCCCFVRDSAHIYITKDVLSKALELMMELCA